jgi:TolA-binding protein
MKMATEKAERIMNLAVRSPWGLALALLLAGWGFGIIERQSRGAEEPPRDTQTGPESMADALPKVAEQEKRLLEEEIKLVDRLIAAQEQQVKNGVSAPESLIDLQRQRLGLERQMAGLEPGPASLARQKALLTEEIKLVEKKLQSVEQRVKIGKATPADIVPVQRELLGLRRQLLELDKAALQPDRGPSSTGSAKPGGFTDEALQRGILQEESDLDLNAAAASYRALIAQFDVQRPLAANAIFRLGECDRRLGRADEAKAQYARILREFPDQTYLVKLAQKYAANALPSANPPAGTGPAPALSSGDEQAVFEWQLAQARNELLLAKSKWMEKQPHAESMADLRRRNLVSEEEARLAQVAQSTAQEQMALWSNEVARLERRLNDLQKSGPAAQSPKEPAVYLVGHVKNSGPQSIPEGGLTLSQAISRAGGFTDFADKKHVKVTRRAGNDNRIFVLDVTAILDKGKPDLKLEPDDLIFVPSRMLTM